jgi:5-methylcytosine-specific restriction enzyme subunit McrC
MTSTPQIPIQNIYYLFCYAWNRFEEAKAVSVGAEASPDLPNLLAKVLLNSSRMLLRRGLDREYQLHSDAIATVRGHIEIGSSLKLHAKRARQLQCEFDELTPDVLHNQILKASMLRIARAPTIDRQLAHDLRTASQRFVGVSDIALKASTFSKYMRTCVRQPHP